MSYKEFIDNILTTRGRFACRDKYKERHHIIPKCMGGTNDKDNLIDLYAREHFEAHRLLALENPEVQGLTYAWWCMSIQTNAYTKERYHITAKEYEEVRIHYIRTHSKAMTGEGNPFYGRKHSDKTRKRIKENHADLSGSKSPCAKSILQYDANGCFVREWDCVVSASKELNIGRHSISRCLTCKQITSHRGRYMWFYKEGFIYDNVLDNIKKLNSIKNERSIRASNKNPSKRAVFCVETKKVYDTMVKASEDMGAQQSKISMSCSGKRNSAGGFKWKYLYDQTKKDGTVIQGAISLGLITEEEALRMLKQ